MVSIPYLPQPYAVLLNSWCKLNFMLFFILWSGVFIILTIYQTLITFCLVFFFVLETLSMFSQILQGLLATAHII